MKKFNFALIVALFVINIFAMETEDIKEAKDNPLISSLPIPI